jgi:hypothetical protein
MTCVAQNRAIATDSLVVYRKGMLYSIPDEHGMIDSVSVDIQLNANMPLPLQKRAEENQKIIELMREAKKPD